MLKTKNLNQLSDDKFNIIQLVRHVRMESNYERIKANSITACVLRADKDDKEKTKIESMPCQPVVDTMECVTWVDKRQTTTREAEKKICCRLIFSCIDSFNKVLEKRYKQFLNGGGSHRVSEHLSLVF